MQFVVEEQQAGRFAGLDGQGGESVIFFVELDHASKVDGADDVDVVKKEGLVDLLGIFEEEPCGFFQASAGVQQNIFAGDFDASSKIVFGFQVVDDLVGKVVDVDDEFRDAEGAEASEGDFEEGAAGEFDEGFGAMVGERPEAGAQTSGQDHCFHRGAFMEGPSLERFPLAQFVQLEMANDDFKAVPVTQAFSQLLGEENGAVLAAGAAERDHQIFESATLILADARVHEREDAGQKLVDTFLLIEEFDDGDVFAGEGFEALFPAWIGETAAVEDEAAAVAGFVLGQTLVKRKTENADDEIVGVAGQALQFFRGQHILEGIHQRRQGDREPDVVKQPAKIFESVGDTL